MSWELIPQKHEAANRSIEIDSSGALGKSRRRGKGGGTLLAMDADGVSSASEWENMVRETYHAEWNSVIS